MTAQAASVDETAIVVFGLDQRNRPHASRFEPGEAELAIKAANLMGMQVFRPATDEQRALVAKLPKGRIFASGKAFTPFVHEGVYGALSAFAGLPARVPATEPKSCRTGSPGAPDAAPGGDRGVRLSPVPHPGRRHPRSRASSPCPRRPRPTRRAVTRGPVPPPRRLAGLLPSPASRQPGPRSPSAASCSPPPGPRRGGGRPSSSR